MSSLMKKKDSDDDDVVSNDDDNDDNSNNINKNNDDNNDEGKGNNKEDETDQLVTQLESKLYVKEEKEEQYDKVLIQIANKIKKSNNILVLTGAGVSVSAGIPDFRTPGTGLYDNLQKYNLPYAEAVFAIDYYAHTPTPFVQLASELWPSIQPGSPKPTITHTFISLLANKNKLLRNYSQNIDGLEHMAEIPEEKLVECHGHFRSATCIRCHTPANIDDVQNTIVHKKEPPVCATCKRGYVKPDIVFFGEQLPTLFHRCLKADIPKADLCLVLGTSLQVPPVAYIPQMVNCTRILINRELVGDINPNEGDDLFYGGDCDDATIQLAKILGWENELIEKNQRTKGVKSGEVKKVTENDKPINDTTTTTDPNQSNNNKKEAEKDQ